MSSPSSSVYDRLYDKRSYTGVYRKRFEGDGRINADTQVSAMRVYNSKYVGSTNTNSNETIHCIQGLMRPNLNYGKTTNVRKASSVMKPSVTESTVTVAPVMMPPPAPVTNTSKTVPTDIDMTDPHAVLKYVFQYYCRFGRTGSKGAEENTMNNANFAKFCRDCPNLLTTSFTKTSVDLIFVKAKKKGCRRIPYSRFLDALGMIASQKYSQLELEESVPKMLEAHIATMPCLTENVGTAQQQQIFGDEGGNDTSSVVQQTIAVEDLLNTLQLDNTRTTQGSDVPVEQVLLPDSAAAAPSV